MLLLHLALSPAGRLLVLGALCHLTAGTTYLALTGISSTRPPIRRQEIGTGTAATMVVAAVMAVVVVLWPIPLICRAVHALRRRASADQPREERIWRALPTVPGRSAGPAATYPVPPQWYRQEYEAARAARAHSAAAGATRAAVLVERSVLAFGPAHPHSHDAWELLEHTARLGRTEHQSLPVPVPAPRAGRPRAAVGYAGVYLPRCPYTT